MADNTKEQQQTAQENKDTLFFKNRKHIGIALALAGLLALALPSLFKKEAPEDSAATADLARAETERTALEARTAEAEANAASFRNAQMPQNAEAAAPAGSHMAIVKDQSYTDITQPAKPIGEVLAEMAGGRKKGALITISSKDLDAKVKSPSQSNETQRLLSKKPAALGSANTKTNMTRFNLAVNCKVFKDEKNYQAFASTHKGKFPQNIDFSKQMAIIMVSMSEWPNRIFEITAIAKEPKKLRVFYRVNPLAANDDVTDFYNIAVTSRSDLPVVTEQGE